MRKLMFTCLAIGVAAIAFATGPSDRAWAQDGKFVTIGTGGQTGVYYVVGQSVCKLVNRSMEEHGIKCTAPSTGGSVDNFNAIRADSREMGVVQSDVQYHAYKGTSMFADQEPF